MQSLIQTVGFFGASGVAHADLNSSNILFSPKTNPTRAVVIDFGSVYTRYSDELEQDTDDAWAETLCVMLMTLSV
jgi:tRNA A-37 threonylcarbamoyl transferase component Bud32